MEASPRKEMPLPNSAAKYFGRLSASQKGTERKSCTQVAQKDLKTEKWHHWGNPLMPFSLLFLVPRTGLEPAQRFH